MAVVLDAGATGVQGGVTLTAAPESYHFSFSGEDAMFVAKNIKFTDGTVSVYAFMTEIEE
jgi:hypothetical protein